MSFASGLPARIRTVDTDQAWGDINFDLILSDWREVGGAKFAFQQLYTANDRVILHQTFDEVVLNPPLAKDLFEIPAAMRSGAQPPMRHDVEFQWIFRRTLAGGLLDTNELGFDPRMGGLRVEEILPGVQHVVGGNPNNLVVEMKDHVVVFDAPPLLPTPEARALAEQMGQIVMVVEAGRTAQGTVGQALDMLEKCPVVMTVLKQPGADTVAITRAIEKAIEEEAQTLSSREPGAGHSDDGQESEGKAQAVLFKHRALPMLEMLKQCHAAEAPIVWGV